MEAPCIQFSLKACIQAVCKFLAASAQGASWCPIPRRCIPPLTEEFDEDLVGDRQPRRGQAQPRAFQYDQASALQRLDPGPQPRVLLLFDARQINSLEVARALEELFVKRRFRRHVFEVFAGSCAARDCGHIR